jgi:hypothetical protein
MVSMQELAVGVLAVIILSSSVCWAALGYEQLPWNVERIRAYCV